MLPSLQPLPVTACLEDYQRQADWLREGHASRNRDVLQLIHENHPKFLDREVPWLPLRLTPEQIAESSFQEDDAQLTLARWYSFKDWAALKDLTEAVAGRNREIYPFEMAVEAVISGDETALATWIRNEPNLLQARSHRVTNFDPPVHRATLLHYIAANGVEGHRQISPPNAPAIARLLLDNGADPNALADMYGGQCSVLAMLVSSSPPAEAGVQIDLIHALLDYGADPNDSGQGSWTSPVMTALVFGFTTAADVLVSRGARADRLSVVAGLGRVADVGPMLPSATAEERHRAFVLSSQSGHVEIVRMLLDAGESPDRFNPKNMHRHSTPMHQAALQGNEALIRLFLQRGARIDIPDKLWNSTPRGWAEFAGHHAIAELLASAEKKA